MGGRVKGGATDVGWVDQIGEGKDSSRGRAEGDATSIRCRSAGVEYPKDYSWLVRPLSDKIQALAPSRGGPWHLGNSAISEANKTRAESFEPAVA